jgi:Flp pilus assembly secretin CpaC
MEDTNKNSQLLIIATVIFLVSSLSYAASIDTQNKIDIKIGYQNTLEIPGDKISRVDVSDSGILSAKISGNNRMTLTGLKKGIASVGITMQKPESIDYIVTTWNILPENIKEMTKDIPGVTFMPTGSKMVLAGGLLTQGDKDRIQKIADVYKEDIDDLTYYDSQQSKNEALKYILKAIGNPNVQASFVGDNVVLKGTVYSKEDKDRAEIAAAAYAGEKGKVSNTIIVMDLPVEIDAAFVQLTPTSGSEIGADAENLGIFQGPSLEMGLKGSPSTPSSLQVGTIGYGLANQKLTYLESKGLAKIIDKPHVSTISGKPGKIQYGGQIGIKTIGSTGGGSVDYKDFGLILKVTPVVGPDNMITIEMELEVSQPISSANVTSGADIEFQKFNTSTFGNVKVGETLIVSGLSQVVRAHSKKNVPFIGNIPVLNLLFANEQKSDKRTDIVVLLTPQIPTIEKKDIAGKGSSGAKDLYGKVTDPNMK